MRATQFFAAFITVGTILGATQGASAKSQNNVRDSFEDRMQMYASWAEETRSGRKLSHISDAYAPGSAPSLPPTPDTPDTPTPNTPDKPEHPAGPPSEYTPGPGTPTSDNPSGSGTGGGCKVLRYHTGFANMTLYYNRTIKDTPNFGECCHHCQNDSLCVAWTRVAGGDPANFRNCYLKYDLDALDMSPDKNLHNHEGHQGDGNLYPELRYVDTDYTSTDVPLILESGTTPDVYPPDYYGCPYAPGNAVSPCIAPPTCNVDGDGKFVAPPCIE